MIIIPRPVPFLRSLYYERRVYRAGSYIAENGYAAADVRMWGGTDDEENRPAYYAPDLGFRIMMRSKPVKVKRRRWAK